MCDLTLRGETKNIFLRRGVDLDGCIGVGNILS